MKDLIFKNKEELCCEIKNIFFQKVDGVSMILPMKYLKDIIQNINKDDYGEINIDLTIDTEKENQYFIIESYWDDDIVLTLEDFYGKDDYKLVEDEYVYIDESLPCSMLSYVNALKEICILGTEE